MEEIIRIEGLEKTFCAQSGTVVALKDVDLTIYKGEIFGIIGLSGAGKSTLVRCINLLERPTAGRIFLAGQDLCALSPRELGLARRSMSMIFQQFNLLMQRTAIQNICFPLEISGVSRESARTRAMELLEIVGLTDKAGAYPAQLSGGQKQRVAIARALATNPQVLLCDEATSALDPTTTRAILTLLGKINRELGITIVIITHEMTVIEEVCQRVAIIDASRIVEHGRVEDIFFRPQSAMAKALIFPPEKRAKPFVPGRTICIKYEGSTAAEPIVGDMILKCGAPVNILMADIKNVDGRNYGRMVAELPESGAAAGRLLTYLTEHNIPWEEES